jgi:hypothetical protein
MDESGFARNIPVILIAAFRFRRDWTAQAGATLLNFSICDKINW